MLQQRAIELLRQIEIFRQITKNSSDYTSDIVRDINRETTKNISNNFDAGPELKKYTDNVLAEFFKKYINIEPYIDTNYDFIASDSEILTAIEYLSYLYNIIMEDRNNISARDLYDSSKSVEFFISFNEKNAIKAVNTTLQKYLNEASVINNLTAVFNEIEAVKFNINNGTGSKVDLHGRDSTLISLLSGEWYVL